MAPYTWCERDPLATEKLAFLARSCSSSTILEFGRRGAMSDLQEACESRE
jgi:hypothetical protein